jgi:hypothetical protein
MNFGTRGNILLTLNVLEILGLFNRGELLAIRPKKRNIKALIADSSARIKSLERKLDTLSLSLEMSLKRPPRFTAVKVAHDWKNILPRVYAIIHGKGDPAFYSHEGSVNIKVVFENFILVDPQVSLFTSSIYNLFYDYEEYFFMTKYSMDFSIGWKIL